MPEKYFYGLRQNGLSIFFTKAIHFNFILKSMAVDIQSIEFIYFVINFLFLKIKFKSIKFNYF